MKETYLGVIFSGNEEPEECLEVGHDHFLPHPF
jgi:hypothetical protein